MPYTNGPLKLPLLETELSHEENGIELPTSAWNRDWSINFDVRRTFTFSFSVVLTSILIKFMFLERFGIWPGFQTYRNWKILVHWSCQLYKFMVLCDFTNVRAFSGRKFHLADVINGTCFLVYFVFHISLLWPAISELLQVSNNDLLCLWISICCYEILRFFHFTCRFEPTCGVGHFLYYRHLWGWHRMIL